MAKRYKPKVKEIKSSPKIAADRGETHKVVLIERCSHWDAKCLTCGKATLVGGQGAEDMLRTWAAWHAAKVEVSIQGKGESHNVQW
jgi:hypothetical protein